MFPFLLCYGIYFLYLCNNIHSVSLCLTERGGRRIAFFPFFCDLSHITLHTINAISLDESKYQKNQMKRLYALLLGK